MIKTTVPHILIAALIALAAALSACSDDSDKATASGSHKGASILPEPKFDDGGDFALTDSIDMIYATLPDPTIDEASRMARADSLAILYAGSTQADDIDDLTPRQFHSIEGALAHMAQSADSAAYFSGILPRMADEYFEYADRLISSPYPYFLVIDKRSMRAVLFDRHGHQVRSYPISASRNYGNKHRRTDRRTPEGFFFARGVYDSSHWNAPGQQPDTTTVGMYGSRFIEIVGTIGVHGTMPGYQGGMGRRESAGCIRMMDADIIELADYVATGMPVIINPSDRDMAVNRNEGDFVGQISVGPAQTLHTRDISAAVSESYPARPELPDSVTLVRSDSIEYRYSLPADSIVETELQLQPDSLSTPAAETSPTNQPKSR